MGKIIIQGSSGGGLDPDEITARASDVLKGKTTIDSDGEVVEGAIERRGTGGENALKIGKNSDSISVSFSAGYYENGNSNDAMPYIKVPYSLLSQTLEINASKILETYTVTGVKGKLQTIPSVSNSLDRAVYSNDNLYVTIQNGAYIYNSFTGHPEIAIHKDKLVKALGVEANKMLSDKNIAGIQGSIPVKSGTSHNTNGTRGGYNNETQRFYCDIERGAYINNCWSGYPEIGIHRDVFIQNLGIRPELLRQGYSLFGVQGTLPDYASQQTVFDGASFFGFMRNGAVYNSTKYGIEDWGRYDNLRMMKNWYMIRDSSYEFTRDGIRHTGGGAFWCDYYISYRDSECYNGFFSYNSIPLSLFRKIRITFFINVYNGNLTRVETSLSFYKKDNESMRQIGSSSVSETPNLEGRGGNLGSYTSEFDISNINENCHINFKFKAVNLKYSDRAYGAINVGKIELIR